MCDVTVPLCMASNQPFTVECEEGCEIPASSRENAVIISDGHSVKKDHTPEITHDDEEK